MKPKLSPQAIASAVERDLGPISTWTSVSEGEESQAFGIRLADEDLILRINRLTEGFQKEAFCYRHFTSASLPIPQILSIGEVDGHAYCVSRRAAGKTLQDLSPAELPPVVARVDEVMRAIAEAPLHGTEGFGRFDANGIGEHESWRGFLAAVADPRRHDWKGCEPAVERRWVDRHLHLLGVLISQCPETRGLVHGDFGSNNVLTDSLAITGVIDWSEALFGDPLYDVANIFFWRPWLACMEAQARFFEEHRLDIMSNAQALRCYQLRIGLQQVFECAVAGDTTDLQWAMARCDAIAVDPPG
ncbi:phosphotransferase [Mesorhizobium sp. 1M-11]|uniref:phosphotransferase family protein n=1 Tax=Mesorhizobium sp. 1M-11 TaxID=1529006 RepID=UPI0006C752D7|nr:phosphotransferase [Mesorhizobium sp. 1M-11]